MKMLQTVCFLFLSIIALSCKNGKQPENQRDNAPLVFEERIFNMESSTCKTDSTRCAYVEITYPVAIQGNPETMSAINDTIMKYIRQSVGIFAESPEDVPASLEDAAAGFIGEYEAFMASEPEFATGWAVETNGKILYQSPEIASIEIATYSYAGGAHPNTYVSLLNFESTTGKKLELTDLVTDIEKLKPLAESKFREARELSPTADLSEEGYFWGEGFALPANVAVTNEGLYFYYNPYEAAAYALGPTDFVISYEELKGIWKER